VKRLALIATLLAFGGAALGAALVDRSYRAEVVLSVGRAKAPLQPVGQQATRTLQELVRSNLLAANIVENLHLRESPDSLLRRISVSSSKPGVLRVTVLHHNGLSALNIAQSVDLVFTRLVRARFGNPVRTLDPAHAAGRTGRPWGLAFGAAAGFAAVLWLALLLLAAARRRPAPIVVRPEPVQGLPEPKPEPEPEPVRVKPSVTRRDLRLAGLERLVVRYGLEFPERTDEWGYYLFFLRDYADIDGRLPEAFEGLVSEVFGDLLERDRTSAGRLKGRA
jgi:capsular polysaccharide biosynthesis protein